MRKFDKRRVGSYYSERIGSSIENKGCIEVQEQGRECKSEIFQIEEVVGSVDDR